MHATLTSALGKLSFATLFLLAVVTAKAQSPAATAGDKQDSSLVKYLGVQDDMVVFNVAYQNPGGAAFDVIIKDQDWTSIYQGRFKDKTFYKQFRFPRADKNKITFIIRNYKGADLAKTFEVNINSRFIQDIAVRKLN